jgi:hypothetical protein
VRKASSEVLWLYLALDEDVDTILKKGLKILTKTKKDLLDVAFQGYEASYFNVTIDLKLTVEDGTVRVHEGWRRDEG